MALLDVTIVNVAIPSMQAGLHTDTATIQLVVSGYALAFGLTLVAGGRLGDVYGRRALMMVGLAGFIVGSTASGLGSDAVLVIAARVLQGMSAGLLTPQSSGLIQQLFSGREREIAFGYFGTTVGIASAIGPILGGALIAVFGQQNGWRHVFGINVPIGLAAMVFIWRWVPGRAASTGRTKAEQHIDVVGAPVLLGATVFSLLLPGSPVCCWWSPSSCRGGCGFTPLQAGLTTTPFAVGTAVMSPIAGRLVARLHRRITVIAIAVMMSGLLAIWLLLPESVNQFRWPLLAAPLLLAGVGGGAVISPNQTLSLSAVPPRMGGAAGAVIQTGQRTGSALGAAVLVTAYQIGRGGGDPVAGLSVTLLTSLVILAIALSAAIWDLLIG